MRLLRVRQAAKGKKDERFTALLHHVTYRRLRDAFFSLKRDASPGIDGVVWHEYRVNLKENLEDLLGRLHRGTYRPSASRRHYIPKDDGSRRALGIATLEDKIAQRALTEVLNAIYEEDFLGFSYGFRPGRNPHNALDALSTGIKVRKVSYILDADIRGFFDAISHEWLMKFVEHRIGDKRILRLLKKWLRAGIIEDGRWHEQKQGTPQGASLSPLLANIYLHYVFDLWIQSWRRKHARGDVIVVRFADDFVIGFQYKDDAERCLDQLKSRMAKFDLALHPKKTRLISFGRYARERCRRKGGKSRRRKPETFDFLGFTHICGTNKVTKKFFVLRKTMKKRMRRKLREVKEELRSRMHQSIYEQGKWLTGVVRGHYRYFGVPCNIHSLQAFRYEVGRLWYKTLRRRSQRSRITWARMKVLIERWLPKAKIYHPWPEERMFVNTLGRSPVR